MQNIRVVRPFLLIAITLLILSAAMAVTCSAATCKVTIDGKAIAIDAEPMMKNNRVLVPVATIVDDLGGESDWDGDKKEVTLICNSTTVKLTIGSTQATVNGASKTMDVAPCIVTVNEDGGGRTMVPLRFVGESFGYDVSWDDSSRIAKINTKGSEPTAPTSDINISNINVNQGQSYGTDASKTYTIINITADRSLQALGLKGEWLADPYRYYIDFSSTVIDSSIPVVFTPVYGANYDKSYVSSVRTGAPLASTARIVVDMKSKVTPEVSYSADGCVMTIAFPDTYSGSVVTDPTTPVTPPEPGANDTETVQGTLKRDTPAGYNPFADGKLVVCIDPGHGNTTGGKRSPDSSLMEYEFNRDVAYRLKALLEANGIETVMTVGKDQTGDPALKERVATANNAGNVDLFVSIHANAYGNGWNSANGWEVYAYKGGGVSELAAKAVEAATMAAVLIKDRGVKTANFYVIKNTEMPAILIEHGFYTNQAECQKLKDSSFRDQLAQADATGIINFFNSYR